MNPPVQNIGNLLINLPPHSTRSRRRHPVAEEHIDTQKTERNRVVARPETGTQGRQDAETAAQKEQRKFREITDQIHDGVAVVDEYGTIFEWNTGQEAITGIYRREALGKTCWEIMTEMDVCCLNGIQYNRRLTDRQYRKVILNLLGSQQPSNKDKQMELEIRHPDGENHMVLLKLFPIPSDQTFFWGAISRDITANRQREKILHESEKLILTGHIASRIAHEINNPLAGVKNSFLLLEKAIPEDYRYYHYVGRVKNEIDRIARIVHQMYELYQVNKEEEKPVHLQKTVEEVIALLESRTRQYQVSIIFDDWAVPDPIRVAEDQIRQVMINLISNAIEASSAHSAVEISASLTAAHVTISIRDHGDGIPEGLHEKVFEPFFSTKTVQSGAGMGLGLSVSKRLVESMGGTLRFTSAKTQGTTFFITLPIIP